MLRAVRLRNFIKFEEDQLLQFNGDGAHLFVGENNSGKSSVLEGIRRCMDMKSNCSFLTNFPNKAKPTYVICDFFLPEDARSKFQNHSRIVTSFVHIPPDDAGSQTSKGAHISAKVVHVTDEGEGQNVDVFIDIIISSNVFLPATNYECLLMEEEKRTLTKELKELPKRKDMKSKTFLETINQIIKRHLTLTGIFSQQTTSSVINKENTTTERILRDLSENVVFTFGLRAIGEVQWSKSSNLRNGKENYSKAAERCEIIRWFEEKTYDTSKADEIFKTLTDGEEFKFNFEKTDGKELLQVVDGSGDKFSILKCPEGILEAKHISLLLSYKPFQTLILEEPDRGMHPQMIHRLRDLVLAAEKDKTIIIVSHNSAVISDMLLPRTFKFCKIRNQNTGNSVINYRFHIVNIGNVLDTIKDARESTPRIASEKYANVLFAKSVLFVEGESDRTFMRTMFTYILNPKTEQSTKTMFDLVSKLHKHKPNVDLEANWPKKLKDLLTTLHVVNMDGHGDKDKWHRFCNAIRTPHIFLLDADAVAKAPTTNESKEIDANDLALAVHKRIVELLKSKRFDDSHAQMIVDLLRKKFLQLNPSIDECKKFTDQEIDKNIDIIREKLHGDLDQENVDIERLTGIIDAKLYGKVYTDEIEQWEIPQPSECQWTENEIFLEKSRIVSDEVKKTFQDLLKAHEWIQARDTLKDDSLFVWRDGSLEDAILGIILETKTGNTVEGTDEIFRKYLSFLSLKINLPLKSFHKRRKKKDKLYSERSGISNENIQSSIEQVFKFCSENSDIVDFLHFLTMYAMRQFI